MSVFEKLEKYKNKRDKITQKMNKISGPYDRRRFALYEELDHFKRDLEEQLEQKENEIDSQIDVIRQELSEEYEKHGNPGVKLTSLNSKIRELEDMIDRRRSERYGRKY